MTPHTKQIIFRENFKPSQLPGLQAYYDLSVPTSYITATGVKLLGDLSGNSNTNVLALNGVAGNYASVPDSVPLSITGDIDIRAYVALVNWTPAAINGLVAKWSGAGTSSWQFRVNATTGVLQLVWSADGTAAIVKGSTVAPTVTNFSGLWVRVTLDVDNGAGGNDVKFYTSPDGVNWAQLGTTVTTAGTTSIFDSTTQLEIGSVGAGGSLLNGVFYRAQIYNGIAGTLVFDADFSGAGKLATSFTERSSNAATVTINTSGDLGARICGARDLVQMTGANQPTLTAGAVPFITFDGVSQYMKAAAWSMGQPVTIFYVGQQKTWTSTDVLFDGSTIGTGQVVQATGTPQLNLNAGSSVAGNTGLAVATNAVITAQFNGASSLLEINNTAPTTGNAGAGTMNGFTLGASATPTLWGNDVVMAVLIYNTAMDLGTRRRVRQWIGSRYGIAVG